MPAHDWQHCANFRLCSDCNTRQRFDAQRGEWLPAVSPICPGDGRDGRRRKPPAPSGRGERIRELVDAG